MSEMMLFPKTWEEFEKQYGFYDIKQAYMYGNTRLIPSFRVQQWLDHIDDIKRKKQSQNNKMAEVAKLLGQKINKRFTVEYFNTKFDCMFFINVSRKYDFTVLDEPEFSFCFTEQLLYALITGEAVIVDEV
jgi:adenine C2-methylase RlmN of 23S rRNA A2503 and tRNA A37